MSEPLTLAQVRDMLREIVAGFPDGYAYEQVPWQDTTACVYTVDGEPSCLIGHLFHRLNIVVPEWHQPMPVHIVVPRVAAGVFTDDALTYLYYVQQAQDAVMPWVDALKFADNVMLDAGLNRSADAAPEAKL